MISNNFRLIFRRASRQKIHSALHLIGLTIGLTVCLIIALFVKHELSYDTYHEKADRTFRVNHIWKEGGELELGYSTPFPVAPTLREEIPELEQVAIVYPQGEKLIELSPNKRFYQDRILFAEASLLDIFDIEVVAGNAYDALRQPYQALLTESLATQYYGRENPIGKTFKYNDRFEVSVAGIIKDLPDNTLLPAKMIMAFLYDDEYMDIPTNSWFFTSGASTFITLRDGMDLTQVNAKLKDVYKRYSINPYNPLATSDAELQAMSHIHFEPQWGGGGRWVKAINPTWLWFFGTVGLIVLFLACINFVNLSTAQAISRAREVSVRKVIGANRKQLISQFIFEAFFFIGISGLLALLITQLAIPYVNELLDKQLAQQILNQPSFIISFLVGIGITGLLTGIYPAWLTSHFQPALALKSGTKKSSKSSSVLRNGLVVVQFSISIVFFIGLVLMAQQMSFFRNQNLGFEKDNIITVRSGSSEKIELFKAELNKISAIKGFTIASHPPGVGNSMITLMSEKPLMDDPNRKEVNVIATDENYFDLFGLKLKEGRFYVPRDTNAMSSTLPREQQSPKLVVNETLVREMGYENAKVAIGKQFNFGINSWKGEIIGVIEDFHTSSLHQSIMPTMFAQIKRDQRTAGLKIAAGSNIPTTITSIEAAWEKVWPKGVFQYHFLDESIEQKYKAEGKLFYLFKIFAGLAMLISCLGLWGLATFASIQRTKEIGIRKVLGASTTTILALLSKDFVKLILMAIIIATPIAWYGMDQWLTNFAYRIKIEWWVFAIAGISALGIAFLTISWQAIRAALANPIEALRNE